MLHVSCKVFVVFVVCNNNKMVRIMERQSSIDTEPRTLNVHQFHFAREAARYVVNTKTLEEALRIFTQGLEPVVRCEGDDRCRKLDEDDQWRRTNINDIHNHKFGNDLEYRDIVTAPF